MTVSWIEIEVVAADNDVFGIRCFEDDDASGTKHAQHFIQQSHQRIEREVLDDMKSGNGAGALIGDALEVDKQILRSDVEAARAALFDLETIIIDAARLDPIVGEQLKPLPAPATKIDHRRMFFHVGQILPKAFLDLF